MVFSRAIASIMVATLGVAAQLSNTTSEPFALASPGQLTQCKNTTIVWQGGKAPYQVSIKPVCGVGQTGLDEDHVVLALDATSLDIPVKYPAGTQLIVSISDANKMQASAPSITVVSGDADGSCTIQTACANTIQAPDVPIALASSSSGTAAPTDHLVTADPSGASTASLPPTATSASMVVLYSYVSEPRPGPSKGPSSPASGSNAAGRKAPTSLFATFGAAAFIGSHLMFG